MNIGYLGYVVTLLYVAGALILLTDVKAYKNANLEKEQKASKVLGWINISLGFTLMSVNWVYNIFL
ncbi:CLC_0170 family protein [Neobacillus bataviensis]|uniref:CLC_0170 family protein n=1 Tax=Neobacillus bataviensis TaxID=220685 RepID=UPI001CBF2C51|nr:CLC_0170 family protein [Neobacillus bataviensis]